MAQAHANNLLFFFVSEVSEGSTSLMQGFYWNHVFYNEKQTKNNQAPLSTEKTSRTDLCIRIICFTTKHHQGTIK